MWSLAKGFCYIAIIVGFLIFFKSNPILTIIIILIILSLFSLYKRRKNNNGNFFGFGRVNASEDKNDFQEKLLLFLLIKQLDFGNSKNNNSKHDDMQHGNIDLINEIERIKQDLLSTLED